MSALSKTNGLWEAIIGLSNGLLVDSATNVSSQMGYVIPKIEKEASVPLLGAANSMPHFGENDVDSVLHLFFTNQLDDSGVYESLCNPPGGNWSGVCLVDFDSQKEYKWTSLPRVSGIDSKRPDHVIQFRSANLLLPIESKDISSDLESDVGSRLKKYMQTLLRIAPNSSRSSREGDWDPAEAALKTKATIISGAAFRFSDEKNLRETLKRGGVDIVFGIEFFEDKTQVVIHIMMAKKAVDLLKIVKNLACKLPGVLETKLHLI